MSKKNHNPGPVPPANQAHAGTTFQPGDGEELPPAGETTPPLDQEQDEKRRLGNFSGKGEHPLQQPGSANGDTHGQ